ncbi:phosphoesterase [Thermococcus profundus]|uniref:Phosphoesterase n=1 Tax=Thermococcus profundus TaxID=49899 RepID=A0A2Z2MAN5_THEPR|nr:metallophosphoesterase [Thermococcus profundus]ASJ03660.1 phosphoesterase [Thermococcus profundus]
MKRVLLSILLAFIVATAGCMGSQSESSKSPTTSSPQTGGIDFNAYGKGQVLEKWAELADTSKVYVSSGYEDLAKHYFPNAQILPVSEYKGGVAVLSPQDARPLMRGRPIVMTVRDYFGYIVYTSSVKFVGPDKGVFAVFNSDGKSYFVFTGTSKAGAGAAIEYAMKLKEGKEKPENVFRDREFEGVVLKVIGDNDWDGIQEEGESWYLTTLKFTEPFIYYWRVVDGENVTVKGGFIRLVNGSTIYIHALGFNVSVEVKNSTGAKLTYVIENTNPEVLQLPEGAEKGDTWVKFTTSNASFRVEAKPIENYRILAFGDHRPGGGTKPPAVFLKIRDRMNSDEGIFIIDGGDLVYTGELDEWVDLMKEWKWNRPIFVAPGNHEYNGEGINIFHMLFGPDNYAFSLGNYRYIILNDVEENYGLSEKTFQWLEDQMKLAVSKGQRPVVILHAPPIDPRPNGHHAMNPKDGQKLLSLMKEYNAFGIFSHIHIYWYGEEDGVQMLITGGGGAPLYASEDQGGFYHYVRLDMGANGTISVEPVKVEP